MSDDEPTCETPVIEENLTKMNGIPPPEEWPNRPIYVRSSPSSIPSSDSVNSHTNDMKQVQNVHSVVDDEKGKSVYDPHSSLIPIDTDLFHGHMRLNVRGIAGLPSDYFEGRKREFEIIVQGKFKRDVHGDKIFTGQCFEHSFIKITRPWLIQSMIFLIKSFIKGVELRVESPQYIISPLLTTIQRISTFALIVQYNYSFNWYIRCQ